jgi:hypothetical protein
MFGTFENNRVGDIGIAGSGSDQGSGVEFLVLGRGSHRALIRNNSIFQYNDQGILLTAGGAPTSTTLLPVHDAAFNITIQGNTISTPYTVGAPAAGNNGIHLNGGTNSPDAYTICLSIGDAVNNALKNNIVNAGAPDTPSGTDFRLRHRFADVTVNLPGYAGTNIDDAAVLAYIQGRNNIGGTPTGTVTHAIPTGAGDGWQGGAACP